MEVDINYLAVFLAGVASMVVGAIWYSKSVFGTVWGKLAKVDMSKPQKPAQMMWLMGSTFVASLVTAYVLAHVAVLSSTYFATSFLSASLSTGFWLWLGLVATRIYVHDAFEGRRKKLTALTTAHELVTIMAMAAVIGYLGQ